MGGRKPQDDSSLGPSSSIPVVDLDGSAAALEALLVPGLGVGRVGASQVFVNGVPSVEGRSDAVAGGVCDNFG